MLKQYLILFFLLFLFTSILSASPSGDIFEDIRIAKIPSKESTWDDTVKICQDDIKLLALSNYLYKIGEHKDSKTACHKSIQFSKTPLKVFQKLPFIKLYYPEFEQFSYEKAISLISSEHEEDVDSIISTLTNATVYSSADKEVILLKAYEKFITTPKNFNSISFFIDHFKGRSASKQLPESMQLKVLEFIKNHAFKQVIEEIQELHKSGIKYATIKAFFQRRPKVFEEIANLENTKKIMSSKRGDLDWNLEDALTVLQDHKINTEKGLEDATADDYERAYRSALRYESQKLGDFYGLKDEQDNIRSTKYNIGRLQYYYALTINEEARKRHHLELARKSFFECQNYDLTTDYVRKIENIHPQGK